jgi:uncharacterized protein (TIGR02270 family)
MPEQAAVLWDVAEEHLDEAEFLVERWLAACRSPRFTAVDLQKTVERRLLAHLDGLVVGGHVVADSLLWPALAPEGDAPASRVAPAALALLAGGGAATGDRLIDILRTTASDPVRTGLELTLKIAAGADLDESLRKALYATDAPAAQRALLAILSSRRVNPGPILPPLLASTDPGVLGGALAAAAAADRSTHRHLIETHLGSEVPAVAIPALRTALIWNLALAAKACVAHVRAGTAEAMVLLALLGGRGEVSELAACLKVPERRASALFALGFTGRIDAVEACLPFLDDTTPRVPGLAVEAIAAITGLLLYDPPFAEPGDGDAGGAAEPPPLAEDLERDLTPSPADELPKPNATEVRRWWSERRSSFNPDERYLLGMPLSAASLQAALRDGPLRRSGALCCEVAIRSGGRAQIPALRLASSAPALPADLGLHRQPGWH